MNPIKAGSTDQEVKLRALDSSTGDAKEDLVYNSAGIALWYRRDGGAKTSISPASLGSVNASHTDGGFIHIDDGYYRLDGPDAAFAGGATGVLFGGTADGTMIVGCYVPLVAYDPQDATRLGLAALQPPIATGTLPSQSGAGTGEVILASAGIGADDQHVGKLFVCYSAPGVIRGSGLITDSVNSTDTITLNGGAALDFTPTSGDTYDIIVGAEVVGVTPEDIPSAEDVRTEMDSNSTKLANLDATVSSRLASGSYSAPPSAASIRSEIDNNSTKLDVAVSTRLASSGVSAVLNTIRKNAARNNYMFKMVDATDLNTAETGLSVTATRSIDGGSFSACANSVSEVANGWYKINLAQADLNGDVIVLRMTATGAAPHEAVLFTQPT